MAMYFKLDVRWSTVRCVVDNTWIVLDIMNGTLGISMAGFKQIIKYWSLIMDNG